MRVRFTEVDGVRTRYYEGGASDAPPMLLVHGGGASADTWFRNVDALGQVRRVYASDLLGHGFTDLLDGAIAEVPKVAQARHVVAFADHLGLDRFVLLGHSFGALIASLVALEHPERIAKFVLVASSSVFHEGGAHGPSLEGARSNQLPALEDPTRERLMRRNVGSNYDDSDPFEEIIAAQMTAMAMPGRREAFLWTTDGLHASASDPATRVKHRLGELTMPVLVVAGRNDPRCNVDAVEAGVTAIPHAELHLFERCGHKPFSEHAARFNEVVTAFAAA